MAPPHVAKVRGNTTPSVTWSRTGYTQKKPFTDVLDLEFAKGVIMSGLGNPDHGLSSSAVCVFVDYWKVNYPSVDIASAGCHDKFASSVSDSAALGVDLAEYHQSVQMIEGAGKKLLNIVDAVRKKDFGKLLKNLDPRTPVPKKRPSWSKGFANNFLEVHFGWVPLCQDIHDAAQAISQPIKANRVNVRKKDKLNYSSHFDAGGGYFLFEDWDCDTVVRMGADVACTNPALHLAQSLGLTNPVSVAWELVPFSFVVDWFANVGQFVGQLDEFAGMALHNAFTTVGINANGQSSAGNPNWNPAVQSYTWYNICVKRRSGIATVPLVLKPLKLPSPTRALTAISLVIQQLGK